jgi:hypothetical protein
MSAPKDIADYNEMLGVEDRALCERLEQIFHVALPEATSKVWHAHPVWFIDGNPIVGYSYRKDGVCVLFWSGQSFTEPGLTPTGSFRAAEYWPPAAEEVDAPQLLRWLADARRIQWNYRDIRSNKGLEKLTKFDEHPVRR